MVTRSVEEIVAPSYDGYGLYMWVIVYGSQVRVEIDTGSLDLRSDDRKRKKPQDTYSLSREDGTNDYYTPLPRLAHSDVKQNAKSQLVDLNSTLRTHLDNLQDKNVDRFSVVG